MSGGIKHDVGKDRWDLLPWDAARGVVAVLGFGANRYGDRNWENGMRWSRPYSALLRHVVAWWERDPADPESGLSHLAHAGCCILFLLSYELRGIGEDDRPPRSCKEPSE